MQVRSPSSDPIRLKAICRGSGMRLYLDGAEVWQGVTCLGTVSAEWLATVVGEKLAQVALIRWTRAELRADPARPLWDTTPPLALPARGLPPPKAVRAERRAARGRRKRPGQDRPPPCRGPLPRPGKM